MDRRRIELQIRAVVVAFRIERRRRDVPTMETFHERARSILESLSEDVRPYPDLESRLRDALAELDMDRRATAHPRSTDEEII